MTKKTQTLLIILGLYFIAVTLGVVTFLYVDMLDLIWRVLVADLVATLVIWFFSLILKNASLYDPYWSVMPPVILILTYLHLNQPMALSVFVMIIAIMVWAMRLTYNWATLWTDFSHVDWRYEMMRKKAPKLYPLTNLFGIQVFPTLIVFIQLIAAIRIIQIQPSINVLFIVGAVIMVMAAMIQWISDRQMQTFKQRHQGEKKCIDEGLWQYTRHPNYFGEIMVWWGLYLMYLSAVKTLDFLIVPPIAMTALFVFVSIPWMEKKILSTRPEYADYQAKVSMLIPFIRKEQKEQTQHEL